MVTLKTNHGDITLELFADKAPKTVENFLSYVKDGFYDGTIFHRVIDGFMIQGGGMTPDMEQKETKAPIENEADRGPHIARPGKGGRQKVCEVYSEQAPRPFPPQQNLR